MLTWIRQFRDSSRETKWFFFQWAFYGLMILATTAYCYARIQAVHDYQNSVKHSISSKQ